MGKVSDFLTTPEPMHSDLRLVDMAPILPIGGILLIWPGPGGWTPLLWFILSFFTMYLTRKYIPDAKKDKVVGFTPYAPEDCPEPFWHETHNYCPQCTWTRPQELCDVKGMVDFGGGPVEVTCTETGTHKDHKCTVRIIPAK